MAVAVVGTPAYRNEWIGSSGAQSFNYALDASANLLLIIALTRDLTLGNRTCATPTWAGSSTGITSAAVADDGNRTRVEAWWLASPTTGTQTLSVTPGGSCNGDLFAYGFSGADTVTPVEADGDYSFGGSGTESVTAAGTSAGSMVVDAIYWSSITFSAGPTADGSQTSMIDDGTNKTASYKAGGGSVTMQWTYTGSLFEASGLYLVIAAGAGGGGAPTTQYPAAPAQRNRRHWGRRF